MPRTIPIPSSAHNLRPDLASCAQPHASVLECAGPPALSAMQQTRAAQLCAILVLLAATLNSGCTTKSNANTRAREAFLAGQRQGIAQVDEARRINIRVIGPVRYPEVRWEDGLTLLKAIAAADYTDARDPRVIVIIRQSERVPVSPRDLLAGKDVPLAPGDTVEIHP